MWDGSVKASEDSPPFCRLLLRISSRQETRAVFSLRALAVFTLPALLLVAPPYPELQSAACAMNAALSVRKPFCAHSSSVYLYELYYRDKTHSYCKRARLWSLYQNRQWDSALKANERTSFFMTPNSFFPLSKPAWIFLFLIFFLVWHLGFTLRSRACLWKVWKAPGIILKSAVILAGNVKEGSNEWFHSSETTSFNTGAGEECWSSQTKTGTPLCQTSNLRSSHCQWTLRWAFAALCDLLTARQHVSCQHNDTTEEQWQQGDCSLLVGLVTFHLAQSSDVHTKSGSENGDRDQNPLKIHKAIMLSFQVERDSCVVCTALPALETCNQQLWDVSLWVTRSASQETFSEQSVVQCQSWIVGAKKNKTTQHTRLHYTI